MKNIIYNIALLMAAAVLLTGCKIEDDYCDRIHPHEEGVDVSIVLCEDDYQPQESKTFVCTIYGSDNTVKARQTVTFTGMSDTRTYDLPYGSYCAFIYDVNTNMENRNMDLLDEGYFFVPSAVAGKYPVGEVRPIVNIDRFFIGSTEFTYTNQNPHFAVSVAAERRAFNVNLRLRFTDELFNLDDVASLTGSLCGVASVFGVHPPEIWEGNSAVRNLSFVRILALEEENPRCMYGTMRILGNDLETITKSIRNELDLRIEYTYEEKVVDLNYDITSLLNGLDQDINIEIKIGVKGEAPVEGDVTLDESWNEDEFTVILN